MLQRIYCYSHRLTFAQLKAKAKDNLAILEEGGVVKKANNYQDMLNSIAKDMLNKHRRRSQRGREIQTLKNTLAVLDEKAKFLDDQIKSYHDYINACIAQLGNKKGFLSPFNRIERVKSRSCSLDNTTTCENSKRAARFPSLAPSSGPLMPCTRREYFFPLTITTRDSLC